MTFLDTSAIYALADRADPRHEAAGACLRDLLARQEVLLTHNYVLLESMALVQARLGHAAAVKLAQSRHAFRIAWVDEIIHAGAEKDLEASGRRHVSLVDQVSFHVMRQHHVTDAFAFDPDFSRHGFRAIPGPA